MPSIPASAIVNVTPSVLSAGGSALDMNGLVLTESTQAPVGTVQAFSTAPAVAEYFGPTSPEYTFAKIYFGGFTNSSLKPGALLFAQYPAEEVGAYLRGGDVSHLTLDQLTAIAGDLTVKIDGTDHVAATLDLAAATSFSAAAAIIASALLPTADVTYDALSGSFVIQSATTGEASTIAYATGTASEALKLTASEGGVISAGSAPATPSAALDVIYANTQNWASFTTLFNPSTEDKVAFADWTDAQNNRFLYAMGDDDEAATVVPDTTSAGALIADAGFEGVMPIYSPGVFDIPAFVMGAIASLDFTRRNGRNTLKFRSQGGLQPGVTSRTIHDNLLANGYNFYGSYATGNDNFVFLNDGSVTGPFAWADSYVNQIQLNNALQLALMELLTTAGSVPYNTEGYTQIEAACRRPIDAAVNFGAIRAGVTLSPAQIAEVNADAGLRISDTLQQVGWYLQVLDAAPEVRDERGSPPCTLWYMDGQSIQHIELSSVNVQ